MAGLEGREALGADGGRLGEEAREDVHVLAARLANLLVQRAGHAADDIPPLLVHIDNVGAVPVLRGRGVSVRVAGRVSEVENVSEIERLRCLRLS